MGAMHTTPAAPQPRHEPLPRERETPRQRYDRNAAALSLAALAMGRPLSPFETHMVLHPLSLLDTPRRYQEALERSAADLEGRESLPVSADPEEDA